MVKMVQKTGKEPMSDEELDGHIKEWLASTPVPEDQLMSSDEIDALIDSVDQGGFVAVSEDSSVLPIDEEAVDFLVHNQAMTEPDARKYVHDTRHLMRSLGVNDITKIDFSLTK